ncbi:hypothetical protein [uncultured Maricaulis sp.]|uniref:hypothetical protein n=1 Tax=uncultured Maricaulis sp. TaxID=174710 RepID=UPI0030D81071|tara:strand:- start:133334 stop:133672 length:339 start_codon:yes stop_codon:yes gene_type:complete
MPAIVYLSDADVVAGRVIDGDEDVDDILQTLREKTGRDYIVRIHTHQRWKPVLGPRVVTRHFELCLACGGEWQVVNLCTREGGSIFHDDGHSREHVMNYMLGLIAGLASGQT